jgi:hypothetical protein
MWALVTGLCVWALFQLGVLLSWNTPPVLVKGAFIFACLMILLGGWLYARQRS